MANKNIFSSTRAVTPPTNTVNEAGGVAYQFSDEHALAQYAVTGCLNGTYYALSSEPPLRLSSVRSSAGLAQDRAPT